MSDLRDLYQDLILEHGKDPRNFRVIEGVHPHDIGTIVDREGVAIRTGHHCAQPVMERFGVPATARASFAMYNTREEVDVLAGALERVRTVFA